MSFSTGTAIGRLEDLFACEYRYMDVLELKLTYSSVRASWSFKLLQRLLPTNRYKIMVTFQGNNLPKTIGKLEDSWSEFATDIRLNFWSSSTLFNFRIDMKERCLEDAY